MRKQRQKSVNKFHCCCLFFKEKKSFVTKIKNKQNKRPKKFTGKANTGYMSKANKGNKSTSKKGRHKKK